ncbi:MAG: hypothetical protein A2157_02195 [Deltaproteobacteria bacterium RBG_16_47_11]|nr:MAG: hypothetical protein A2157_02195 [Deltaproteobacteria bacterium RBG_16_47_11]
MSHQALDFLFVPRSIALVGITISKPDHWTRTFLDSLLEFRFKGQIYLVNPRGGEIHGLKVYKSLDDISGEVDYVISTVPAQAALNLVEECAGKGVRAIHFCTAGFSETGEEGRKRLEAELAELSREKGVRIIGPNCMGIYCPDSGLSFHTDFPKESGSVGFISQSGGNAIDLIRLVMWRGVRFNKVVSYGNACDLNESDFLEYLGSDPYTKIVALYIEGVKDGRRFRQALTKAADQKVIILLKGGTTTGGTRAVAGHTGALAGNDAIWDALCKQLRVIRVHSMDQLADTLVTLSFMDVPRGRNVALIGVGGGASVLITDEFEKRGLNVPPLPQTIRSYIQEFTPIAGNILRNPIDCSQTLTETKNIVRILDIISSWSAIDFLVGFLRPSQASPSVRGAMVQMVEKMLNKSKAASKPMAVMLEPSILPKEAKEVFSFIQEFVSFKLPVYFSFSSAADALNLVLNYYESLDNKLRTKPS